MKNILTLRQKDVYPGSKSKKPKYRMRTAARALLFDSQNRIALEFVSLRKYYKLPGGGVEKGESIILGLRRECMEETGCEIKPGEAIGKIVEYRDRYRIHQVSYCYFAKVAGKKGKTAFTGSEKTNKFKLRWVPLGKAITLLRKAKPSTYESGFIIKRDLKFLETAKKETAKKLM